jgi:AcrR family transcriptional regulator
MSKPVRTRKSGRQAGVDRPFGRPRLLTAEVVLEVASNIGVKDLSMKALADALGIGVATLYGYVGSRAELVAQVAQMQAKTFQHITDSGQHWSCILRENARAIYGLFTSDPSYTILWIEGGMGPRIEGEHLEAVLALLQARGFTAREALLAQRLVGHMAYAIASSRLHMQAMASNGLSHSAEFHELAAASGPESFPALRACGEEFLDPARHADLEAAIDQILLGIAASRGEPLPSAGTPWFPLPASPTQRAGKAQVVAAE